MTKDERIAELNWVMDIIEAYGKDPFQVESAETPGARNQDDAFTGYECALTDLEHAIRERVFKIMAGVA